MPIYDQESLEPKEIHPGVKVRIMHGEKHNDDVGRYFSRRKCTYSYP